MRGFYLDPATHDLVCTADGSQFVTVDGVAAARQEIKTRLRLLKGEFFLDLREGVPYFQEILLKNVDLARVKQIVRETIRTVPGVVDVPDVAIDLDRASRCATINFRVRYQDREEFLSDEFGPLLIDLS